MSKTREQIEPVVLMAWIQQLRETGKITDKTFDQLRNVIFLDSTLTGSISVTVTRYHGARQAREMGQEAARA